MKRIAILLVVTIVYFGLVPLSLAVVEEKTAEKGEVINEICPVLGGKVDKDTPFRVEYEGKTIGFCCAGCVETFKAEPEKYMKNLKLKGKKSIIRCPECDAEIDVTAKSNKMNCPAR